MITILDGNKQTLCNAQTIGMMPERQRKKTTWTMFPILLCPMGHMQETTTHLPTDRGEVQSY